MATAQYKHGAADSTMDRDRFFQAATVLRDGWLLFTGGYIGGFLSTNMAWIYKP
ncbi:MAG: hypothetical protein ABI670_22060 [Chloroflexota bacterium]